MGSSCVLGMMLSCVASLESGIMCFAGGRKPVGSWGFSPWSSSNVIDGWGEWHGVGCCCCSNICCRSCTCFLSVSSSVECEVGLVRLMVVGGGVLE